jgi:ADP-ribose pyrophosphatase YjhB (NUDIX family)
MKQAVRAIVIKDNQLLTMHRNKFGQQYYTLVGGGVDMGEQLEAALMREIQEETGLQVANPRLVYIEEAEPMYGTQYVYLCDYVGGEIALSPQSEEAQINQLGQNLYQPMWLPLAQLPDTAFVSPGLKQRILTVAQQGWHWPDTPEHFQHTQAAFN